MGIRVRTLRDGTKVFDAQAHVGSSHHDNHYIHLGTFYTRADAEEMMVLWKETLERDKEILRERQLGVRDRAS